MSGVTDAVKRALCEQVEALRPLYDGPRPPDSLRTVVYLLPDGRIRRIEVTPGFTVEVAKR